MSEIKLVVRDETRDISMICHGSDAQCVVAALSADPVTIEELEVALQRFMKAGANEFFHDAANGMDDEPADSGLVVIDLVARLIVVDSTYFTMTYSGQVFYHDGEKQTDMAIGYTLSDQWRIAGGEDYWWKTAADRRRARAGKVSIDSRAVLYGRPLLEFLAGECWQAFQKCGQNISNATAEPPADERSASPFYDILKEIHARWLMTPCTELGGVIPRDVLLADHARLSEDMQQRCNQWALTQECPRGLDVTSHAFRFGGFGTHELVKYYEMIRELLWSCWATLAELATSGLVDLARFLNREMPRLDRVRDEWLNTPDPDCYHRTPQSMIDLERARLPEALFGRDAIIDPDCPCCQMLAELPGPNFLHLDSSVMDCQFPFDIYCLTREEWDIQQSEYTVASESADDELNEMPAMSRASDTGSVWTRSFSMAESTELPLGKRLFGIASHLTELVMKLNELSDSRATIDQLNSEFREMRKVLSASDNSPQHSAFSLVLDRFNGTLATVAKNYSDLGPRCNDLARMVKSLRERSSPVSS